MRPGDVGGWETGGIQRGYLNMTFSEQAVIVKWRDALSRRATTANLRYRDSLLICLDPLSSLAVPDQGRGRIGTT